jgi:hypothetical protein
VLSVDDFYVPQVPAVPAVVEPDLRLRTKYSMARFYQCTPTDSCYTFAHEAMAPLASYSDAAPRSAARLLLLTEDGVVRLVDCAPSDAAMAHQIERFQQRLERAPKRGLNPSPLSSPCQPLLSQHAVWLCRVSCVVCRVRSCVVCGRVSCRGLT